MRLVINLCPCINNAHGISLQTEKSGSIARKLKETEKSGSIARKLKETEINGKIRKNSEANGRKRKVAKLNVVFLQSVNL